MQTKGIVKPPNPVRELALGLMLMAVAIVAIKVTLWDNVEVSEPAEVQLPEAVPLGNWQALSAEELGDQQLETANYKKGREYRYQTEFSSLNVQARYFSPTSGNVRGFIKNYLPNSLEQSNWELHRLDETGTYLMLVEPRQIQISSCINPYGKSTVSAKAYKQNRNFQDIRYRLIPWLLGEPLKDERCLWTHMLIAQTSDDQVPLNDDAQEAWILWYEWWSDQLSKMEG
ncbi:MAG: cyanoexosortase A system-associated protein [Cyanobacteria bacterium J06555_13]